MAPSLYNQSVPVLKKFLNNFSNILDFAAKYAAEKGIKDEELINASLYEDMKSLPFQVQSCCNTSKHLAVRIGGIEAPVEPDDEQTFEQLQARLKRTMALLDTVQPAKVDGREDDVITWKMGSLGDTSMTAQRYISEYAIPNFHFHLSTGYCILRNRGVPLSARHYLKDVFPGF